MCLHKWIVERDTGKTIYERCSKCGDKRIRQQPGGYQPVNLCYLEKDVGGSG